MRKFWQEGRREMAAGPDVPRVRAWMVIRGEFDVDHVGLVMALDRTDDEYVVVRADLVTSLNGRRPGMVIPLDTLMGDEPSNKYLHLYAIRDQIVEALKLGSDDYDLLEVGIPDDSAPPHTASGFITRAEAHAAIDLGERGGKPGRQDHSPGFNPWG
jgi:hypothetical protein